MGLELSCKESSIMLVVIALSEIGEKGVVKDVGQNHVSANVLFD